MSDHTGIEWTDATWNPTTGCKKVSPGCDHCYAETLYERFHGRGSFATVLLHPERLDRPLRWRKPRRIFVNSMSDLFHDDVPDDFIAQVFAVMAAADRHTFQVLTKRHGRMRSLLGRASFRDEVAEQLTELLSAGRLPRGAPLIFDRKTETGNVWGPEEWPLRNVWLGVSVENQQWADIRIPALIETPAAVRFLSCEPLLGPVCLDAFHSVDGHAPGTDLPCEAWPAVDWVIVGGESGHHARPMHPEWARSLRDQCTAAGIPFLFKQWGEHTKVEIRGAQPGDVWVLGEGGHPPIPWRLDTEGAQAHRWGPHRDELMRRVGKKAAGRELDGRTWDEFPQAVTA